MKIALDMPEEYCKEFANKPAVIVTADLLALLDPSPLACDHGLVIFNQLTGPTHAKALCLGFPRTLLVVKHLTAALVLVALGASLAFGLELSVPDGFTVELVAREPAVRFPMFACLDDAGRLYVAESSGLDLYAELKALTRKCRVSRLEDVDGDGRYERATVFAENLVYPMGLAWRDGWLYVADPPEVAAFADTDGDGRADQRRRILGDFGHLDNGSLHGLNFGPDGLLYLTMGSPDGYRLERPNGQVLEGKSGALIRCNPDGSNPEVLGRGFVNLVEVVFLPSGEIIGTDNWFSLPEGGVRDALVDIADGGLHPYLGDTGTRYPMTGVMLPPVARFPAVALSGLELYRGTAFPPALHGQLFCAQHNSRQVTRHRLLRDGSTFRTEDFDFVKSSDPDFHPADVLEDFDGSLLIVDTGSWYVQHCPTGRIRGSMAPGGIYRVRRAGVEVDRLRRSPKLAPLSLRDDLRSSDEDIAARSARNLASRGDRSRENDLIELLASPSLAVRRAAAEALARVGGKASVGPLITALGQDVDAYLEHALILAIERVGGLAILSRELEQPDAPPRVQRAALQLLAQEPGRWPPRGAVAMRLAASDLALRRTAQEILLRRSDWIEDALGVVKALLKRPLLSADEFTVLEELLRVFGDRPEMAALVARGVDGAEDVPEPTRRSLIDALSRYGKRPLPAAWIEALRQILRAGPVELQADALRVARSCGSGDLDRELTAIAADPQAAVTLRLEALALAAPRLGEPATELFALVLTQLARADDPLARLSAAETLTALRASRGQLEQALAIWRDDGVLPRGLFEQLRGQARAAGAAGVPRERPPVVGDEARARLAALEPLLAGGDAARGRAVFQGPRAACATCHRVAAAGGGVGPDLTKLGAIRSGRDVLESIVVPSSTFAQGYEPWMLVAGDGQAVTGIIARQTEGMVTLRLASGAESSFVRAEIQSLERAEASIMPEGIDTLLSGDELRDLLAFLLSLR